jgi:rRNA-processing protein FCF1
MLLNATFIKTDMKKELDIQKELEAIRNAKFKKSVNQIYKQLETITQDELEMSLEEFLQLHKLLNKGD